MCYRKNTILEKIVELSSNGATIILSPSIDTVEDEVASYIRCGFDSTLVYDNIKYVLENTQINLEILSLMTAHTIWGIDKTFTYFNDLSNEYPGRITWTLSHLTTPYNQSFAILSDEERMRAVSLVESVTAKDTTQFALHLNIVLNALKSTSYDYIARTDQQYFFKQFNERTKSTTPEELKFLIEDKI